MDKLNNIVLLIQHYLADYILIILLLGGGVIFTIRLGFIQIRGFKAGWKRTFGGLFSKKGTAGKDGMSSFQAEMISLYLLFYLTDETCASI